MPLRKIPIIEGEIYHIYNRTVAKEPVFESKRNIERALYTLKYYAFDNLPLRFSHFERLPKVDKEEVWKSIIKKGSKRIEVFAFCLMPTHYHFLLKEIKKGGISSFISNFQNSIAKYINIKFDRNGALFQLMFKALRIETDEQFIHIARYIHLNPFTSYIVNKPEELDHYWGSSFPDYIGLRNLEVVNKDFLLKFFNSVKKLKEFTYDQKDYQRKLAKIKYLAID